MQNIHRKSFEFHVAIKWNGLPEGIKPYPQIQHLNMLLKFSTRILFYYHLLFLVLLASFVVKCNFDFSVDYVKRKRTPQKY